MDWHIIRTEQDLAELFEAVDGFHDSCLREVHIWTDLFVDRQRTMQGAGDATLHVRLLIQSQKAQAPTAVELWFEDAVGAFISQAPRNYDQWIRRGTLVKRDDLYYWATEPEWTPEEAASAPGQWDTSSGAAVGPATWFGGRRLRWRDASDWMGSDLRYAATRAADDALDG